MLAVVIGRAAPLRVENTAVVSRHSFTVIRVPSHAILLCDGCHRQRRRLRHLHARLLVYSVPNVTNFLSSIHNALHAFDTLSRDAGLHQDLVVRPAAARRTVGAALDNGLSPPPLLSHSYQAAGRPGAASRAKARTGPTPLHAFVTRVSPLPRNMISVFCASSCSFACAPTLLLCFSH